MTVTEAPPAVALAGTAALPLALPLPPAILLDGLHGGRTELVVLLRELGELRSKRLLGTS